MKCAYLSFLCALCIGFGSAQALATTDTATVPVPASPPDASVPPLPSAPAAPDNKEMGPEYLRQAQKAYSEGHYKEALTALSHAQNSIRAKHAELYRPLLPAAPKGWEASQAVESATLGSQMMGGASVIGRKYTGNGHTVTLGYVIDSPTLTFMSAMVQAIASSSAPGTSIETVKNNKAIYKEQRNAKTNAMSYTLTVLCGDTAVIVSSPTLKKDTLLAFANIVDYDALKKLD